MVGTRLEPVTDDGPEPLPLTPRPAFDDFFRAEYPRIVALVLALSGDHQGAEDVAQEALLRASDRWDRVGSYDRPGAWVRRVALNLSLNARARRRSEAAAVNRLGARPPLPPADAETDGFWNMVRRLPPRQAAAVSLHYLEDLSVADVAAVLGCAEGTAKAHLSKGRAGLARLLDEPEDRP